MVVVMLNGGDNSCGVLVTMIIVIVMVMLSINVLQI